MAQSSGRPRQLESSGQNTREEEATQRENSRELQSPLSSLRWSVHACAGKTGWRKNHKKGATETIQSSHKAGNSFCSHL